MLELNNCDIFGVEDANEPEWVDFWDSGIASEDIFPDDHLDAEPKSELLQQLINEKRTADYQLELYSKLVPASAEKAKKQHAEAVDSIERQVKKLIGSGCRYTKK